MSNEIKLRVNFRLRLRLSRKLYQPPPNLPHPGEAMSLIVFLQNLFYRFENIINFIKNLIVPESDQSYSQSIEAIRSSSVSFILMWILMNISIKFNRKHRVITKKVNNKFRNRVLTPKTVTF